MWETLDRQSAMGPQPVCLLFITLLGICISIYDVKITILPHNNVDSGTDVQLKCNASIFQSSTPHKRQYVFYKNDKMVNASESEADWQIISIPQARVADSGEYHCEVKVDGKKQFSSKVKLTVKGLQTPTLVLNDNFVSEGDEVLANCSAPLEHGPFFFFYFFENTTELKKLESTANTAVASLHLKAGLQKQLYCKYMVDLRPERVESGPSNTVTLDVQELLITPSISVWPANTVVEGDRFVIKCTIRAQHKDLSIYLFQVVPGNLFAGNNTVQLNVTANATHAGLYICKGEMRNVYKQVETRITVVELFSKPTLSMHPEEVFENDTFTLTCSTANINQQRIQWSELKYSIYKDSTVISESSSYSATAGLHFDGNYFCKIEARTISKDSSKLDLRVKELVSQPLIKALGTVVLRKQFWVECRSERGHHPVHYILMKNHVPVQNVTVKESNRSAFFQTSIQNVSEIYDFTCQAENNGPLSRTVGHKLNASVVVPVVQPKLLASPDIVEGNNLTFVCRIESGSPPVTFEWYKQGSTRPMTTSVVRERLSQELQKGSAWDSLDFWPLFGEMQKEMKKEDAGKYYCRALNNAGDAFSAPVHVNVELAHWKKGLIVAVCLLLVAAIVIGALVWCRGRRGRASYRRSERPKPSSPKSDDSVTVSLGYNTDVYNAHKDAEPQCDGTEGRATNGIRDSVASFPANGSPRSSCSSPATV
ncbi:platelet endothelial cell adhesion molecule-like isoform X2 [Arapaima gigas]